MSSTTHPSFMDLDTFVLGAGRDAVRAHVDDCPRCRSYCDELRLPVVRPRWLGELEAAELPRARRRFVPWAAVAVACAAIALLVPLARNALTTAPQDDLALPLPAATAKGDPAVGIYILHGGRVALWDGHRAVSEGDRLRVKVAPAGRRFVHLASGGAGHEQTLYAAPLDSAPEVLLPGSWEVSGNDAQETLIVGLSDTALSLEQLLAPVPAGSTAWVRRYVLPRVETGR